MIYFKKWFVIYLKRSEQPMNRLPNFGQWSSLSSIINNLKIKILLEGREYFTIPLMYTVHTNTHFRRYSTVGDLDGLLPSKSKPQVSRDLLVTSTGGGGGG